MIDQHVFKFTSHVKTGPLASAFEALSDVIYQTLSVHRLRNSGFELTLFEHYAMTNIAMLFGNNNAQVCVETIFADEQMRDYVLDLSVRFYARYTDQSEEYFEMVKALSRALSPFSYSVNFEQIYPESFVPEAVSDVIMLPVSIENFLTVHRWIIPYYISLLYVQIEHTE